ncbi:MAG: 4Fe-4S dicluster domain-containing protein [Victivallales bacterium]|nr:4Fe-4S dicluster domain-containing protein [Victivallales bacterium]
MSKYKYLKILRVICALSVLLIFASVFILPENFLFPAASWQLLPTVFRTAAGIGIAAGCMLTVLLFSALVFGRVYCSFFCPLGMVQDIAVRLAKTSGVSGGRKRFRPNRRRLRYAVFALLGAVAVSGTATVPGWFGPFAVFGRFAAAAVKPLFNRVHNFIADSSWVENLYPLGNAPFSMPLLVFGVLIAGVIFTAAFFRGRIFCNTFCPVGALLGLGARVSWFKITLDGKECVKCGKCLQVCKADCIDLKSGIIDNERCVACFNCVAVCNFAALDYTHPGKREKISAGPDLSRRDFLVIGGSALIGAAIVPGVLKRVPAAPQTVMPPGAFDFERFTARCTACQLCVSNCPGKVLKPAALEYGLGGFLQPRLDFDSGMCEYECTRCSNICPNGALQPLTVARKKLLQLGTAEYFRDRCVVFTDRTYCGACAEHCPTGAVHMVEWEEGLTIPKVEAELCIGCGACEYICPARPRKAIIVTGTPHQGTARTANRKRAVNHLKGKDFPF